jgi:malate dehydrogenase (oxaloacetate-decarboxylating)
VISGSGAAGSSAARLLRSYGASDITLLDSQGIISSRRKDLNSAKKGFLDWTNKRDVCCGLSEAIKDADIFIGVSKADLLTAEHVKSMARGPIIFAMANPVPEIMPDIAKAAGAAVVAPGRSDFANQVNNLLVFPGLFRGVIDAGIRKITVEMKLAAARALAAYVGTPTADRIIPDPLDRKVASIVAEAVKGAK